MRVVDSLGLQFSYNAIGKIKTVNIYKQAPFLIEALEISDSSRSFTFKIKFQNDNEFRINDEIRPFKFDNVFRNANGHFGLIRKPNSTVSKEYSVNWAPTLLVANQYAEGYSGYSKNSWYRYFDR